MSNFYRVKDHNLYNTWANIKQRCNNPNDKDYHRYGGRGIKLCERWSISFYNFLSDVGERPSDKHSLDRSDNDGDYTPDNCRWSTATEQNNNTSRNVYVSINGKTLSYAEWERENNLTPELISSRISRGWTPERAVLTPVRKMTRTTNYKKISRDANHLDIVKALINEGFSVYDFSSLGGGIPDICVGITCKSNRKINLLIEIKSSKKAHIRESQHKFQREWLGQQTLVSSIEDALYICNWHYQND